MILKEVKNFYFLLIELLNINYFISKLILTKSILIKLILSIINSTKTNHTIICPKRIKFLLVNICVSWCHMFAHTLYRSNVYSFHSMSLAWLRYHLIRGMINYSIADLSCYGWSFSHLAWGNYCLFGAWRHEWHLRLSDI